MIVLLLVAAASPTGDAMIAARDAYQACVLSQTVELGNGNQESSDTVLRAVGSRCADQWSRLLLAFPSGGGDAGYEQIRLKALGSWRRQAEDAAVAALLDARRKSP